MERAKAEFHSFLAAAPQMTTCPLTQFCKECCHSCVLSEWMDKTLRLGYSFQFSCVPSLFSGIKEINLSFQEEIDFLSEEIQDQLSKQAVWVFPTHNRQKGFYSTYFLVPKKTGDFIPIVDLHILNQCIVRKMFLMLTIRRLLESIQPAGSPPST